MVGVHILLHIDSILKFWIYFNDCSPVHYGHGHFYDYGHLLKHNTAYLLSSYSFYSNSFEQQMLR